MLALALCIAIAVGLQKGGPYIGEGWLTEEFVLQRLTPEESEFNLGWIFLAEADGLPLHTTGPSADMARAFAHAAPSPGLSCPDVRDLWERELALRRDAGPVELPDHDGEPPSASVGLRRAVVSPDGREAIVYADLIYGPESGYGFLILFRRNMSGHWWEAARLGVWIS